LYPELFEYQMMAPGNPIDTAMTVVVDKIATSTQTRRMDHEMCNSYLFHNWTSIGLDAMPILQLW
jgi:hypothetical protein